ncbi:interleukin-15-like isoform X2 [Chelmon rostratus]|uniref:interleukin-15-like isoform X2 n=1 Tax=Chelmon rostratus TaxID=109905 RepID=UPI001BE706ED|nr:interleukin-15-like isoform X2 [Chelmon rostratus]
MSCRDQHAACLLRRMSPLKASSSSRPVTCAERASKLSVLSTCTCAASVPGTADVQTCLEGLKHAIQKSDAMLYAPSVNDVEDKCKIMSLRCYMLELIMVIDEEEIIDDNNADCLMDFNDILPPEANSVGCPPCEAYSLKNITTFLERLNSLLQEMTSTNT